MAEVSFLIFSSIRPRSFSLQSLTAKNVTPQLAKERKNVHFWKKFFIDGERRRSGSINLLDWL